MRVRVRARDGGGTLVTPRRGIRKHVLSLACRRCRLGHRRARLSECGLPTAGRRGHLVHPTPPFCTYGTRGRGNARVSVTSIPNQSLIKTAACGHAQITSTDSPASARKIAVHYGVRRPHIVGSYVTNTGVLSLGRDRHDPAGISFPTVGSSRRAPKHRRHGCPSYRCGK